MAAKSRRGRTRRTRSNAAPGLLPPPRALAIPHYRAPPFPPPISRLCLSASAQAAQSLFNSLPASTHQGIVGCGTTQQAATQDLAEQIRKIVEEPVENRLISDAGNKGRIFDRTHPDPGWCDCGACACADGQLCCNTTASACCKAGDCQVCDAVSQTCRSTCSPTETCVNGACCPNTLVCGAPSATTCCAPGQPCVNGQCGCPAGETLSYGHCCPTGQTWDAAQGHCTCATCEVYDTASGTCKSSCPPTAGCCDVNGVKQCVEMQNNPSVEAQNCGACGNTCPGQAGCYKGQCIGCSGGCCPPVYLCTNGFTGICCRLDLVKAGTCGQNPGPPFNIYAGACPP